MRQKEVEGMEKGKNKSLLKRVKPYMGKRAGFPYIAIALGAISSVLLIVPFLYVYKIVRLLILEDFNLVQDQIKSYAMYAMGFMIAYIIAYFAALMFAHFAAFKVEINIQKTAFKRLMNMPLGYFDVHETGAIRKTINDGAATTHEFFAHQLPDLGASIVGVIATIVIILYTDWKLGIICLLPLVLGMLGMSILMKLVSKDFMKQYMDSLEEMSGQATEYIRGMPVIKTFGQSIYSFRLFYKMISNYTEKVVAYTKSWKHSYTIYTVLMSAIPLFLVPVVIYMMEGSANPLILIVDFILFLLLAPNITIFTMRSMNVNQIQLQTMNALDKIDEALTYDDMKEEAAGYDKNTQKFDSLEFDKVSFAYNKEDKDVLHDISFKLNTGEHLALVGNSGSGKTTIARLCARFWDAGSGSVKVGGMDIRSIPKKDLMDNISFVFQNSYMFEGTLRENIVFGQENVSEEALNAAIDKSRSREIVDKLPDGLDTVLGSKGTYLSVGEKQRIALARAFIKDAPIIILDEATAFADPENEEQILAALSDLKAGKTTIMIAHRLNSVKGMDRILVIEEGRITEDGSFNALIEKDGRFKAMWDEYVSTIVWTVGSSKNTGKEAE